MGKSSGGPPPNFIGQYVDKDGKPLDPTKVALGQASGQYVPGSVERQEQSSKDAVGAQTQANRPNVDTTWGGQNWTQGPDGSWQLQTSLSPELQGLAAQYSQQLRAGLSAPMDDGSGARQQTMQAAYGQARSRLDPMFSQQQQALRAQLAANGLDPSSQAAQTSQADFSRGRNDAYQQAMSGAAGQGDAAQHAVFANNMSARELPLQQMQALYGFGGTPSFDPASAWGPQRYLDADKYSYDSSVGRAGMENQKVADMAKGFGSAAGAIVGGAG